MAKRPPTRPENPRAISDPHGVSPERDGGETAQHPPPEHRPAAEEAVVPRCPKTPCQSSRSAENRAPLSAGGDVENAKRSRRRVPDKRRLIARDPRGFFSMKETCDITSLSRSQIMRMVERGTFPEYRLLTDDPNGRKGFRVLEVLKWLADRG